MKRILLTALLALNTSIASAAIQLYTFTGSVINTSGGGHTALINDATTYTIAIDFLADGYVDYINSSPSIYPDVDGNGIDYFYADFYSGSNHVTDGVADYSDSGSAQLYRGLTDTNSGTALLYTGDSSEFITLQVDSGQQFADYFALGATWLANENSYNFDGSSSSSVVSSLTLTSISSVSPVPEPSTLALMLAGFGLIGFKSHRRNKLSA